MLNAVLSTSSDHNKGDGGHSVLSKRSLEKMNDLCDEKELVDMIKHMDKDKSLFHPQSKPLEIIKKMDKLHSNLLPESYLNQHISERKYSHRKLENMKTEELDDVKKNTDSN